MKESDCWLPSDAACQTKSRCSASQVTSFREVGSRRIGGLRLRVPGRYFGSYLLLDTMNKDWIVIVYVLLHWFSPLWRTTFLLLSVIYNFHSSSFWLLLRAMSKFCLAVWRTIHRLGPSGIQWRATFRCWKHGCMIYIQPIPIFNSSLPSRMK